MSRRVCTLLTGATGLLGRYLFRDLLRDGNPLAVLVRDSSGESAGDRIRSIHAYWQESLQQKLPSPVVVAGDLRDAGLRLAAGDRTWLSRHCEAIVHAAANLSFQSSTDGEPRRTNVAGTQRLMGLAREFGIDQFHHISTAFVCGDRPGPIFEDELDRQQRFHNVYEGSKAEAERIVRSDPAVRATIYRPSVIVGDSQTGYTNTYHGFYHFLDAANRLAKPMRAADGSRRRRLALRLPLNGEEPRNLVPVDWVSKAIVRIVREPALHGRAYHLVARRPTTVADIKAVAEEVLGLDGIELTGRNALVERTPLEEAFLGAVRDYSPYLAGDPEFDDRNAQSALPDLAAPNVDRPMLARMIRFAVADRWGRRRQIVTSQHYVDCRDYIERYFPAAAEESFLAQLPIDIALGFQVRGPGGGDWLCRVKHGCVTEVVRNTIEPADVVYRTDVETFAAVVRAAQTPQSAFFSRRIQITGSIEKGLKLATLFARFVREHPYQPATEGRHAFTSAR
jgi:thioester reductase-like protein